MNWNYNDTKYILKRFIIYILIAFAMFIIGTWKADAAIERSTPSILYHSPINNVFNNRVISDGHYWGVDINNLGNLDSLIWHYNYTPRNGNNVLYNYTFYLYSSFDTLNINLNGRACYSLATPEQSTATGNQNMNNTKFMVFCPNIPYSNGLDVGMYNEIVNTWGRTWTIGISWDIDCQPMNVNDVASAVNDVNNSINNDNVTTSDADNFSNNEAFSDSTGLESVIQLPLNMVNSLTSTCEPIQVTIPFINYSGEIPCMSTIYRSKFNVLYTIVKIVINGFFVYRLLLKVYELVHNAKQPDEDKLEVIDL